MMLDWPDFADRTPEEERKDESKFSVGYRQTKSDLRKEFERMGVEKWTLDDVTGSGGDPGVVVRWVDDGHERVVACDAYTSKSQNLREIYTWISETRLRSNRPVVTAGESFAAARLPPADGTTATADDTAVAAREPPHEILGVAEDAPDPVVVGAFRELTKEGHSDQGDNPEYDVEDLKWARDQMIDD